MTETANIDAQTQSEEQPLNEAQRKQLLLALYRSRKMNTAAGVANFNGWTLGLFAFLSFAVFLVMLPHSVSMVALIIGLALGITSFNEFLGRRQLKKFQPAGPKLLAANQLLLMAIILGYCVNRVYVAWTADYSEMTQPLAEAGLQLDAENIMNVVQGLMLLTYSLVALGSILFQGLNSLYYYSTHKHLQKYLKQTPTWVIEVLRELPR